MVKDKHVWALIPARSGSKGIKDKNIIDFKGKPLLAHSIEQALESRYVDAVYVSTDSEKYAHIAKSYGARVPFLRPAEISGDFSTDFEVFSHFTSYHANLGTPLPELIVHLRPTYPTRRVEELDEAILFFADRFDQADSLRSVIEAPETPYKMWKKDGDFLKPLLTLPDIAEPYNMPRQKLPKVYFQNACIDIVKTTTILEKESMTGSRILMFEMDRHEFNDIDVLEDLKKIK